jgi:undecaprenyl-diphosphatase
MTAGSLHALVLGLVQGLTEFLPISSSAHLILIPRYLGWEDPGLAFDVALHLGTLAGVLIYFWKDLCHLATHLDEQKERNTALYLMLATIPGAVAGLLLEHKAETVFRSPALIAGVIILMGTLLGMADWLSKGNKTIADLTLGSALGLGLAQGFALIPGVSRSGIIITTALALGLNRKESAKFSFLMSIPIIAGAGVLKSRAIWHSPDKLALGAGFLASTLAGLFAIWLLFKIIQTRRYTPFVLYRWALGAFVLLNLARFNS